MINNSANVFLKFCLYQKVEYVYLFSPYTLLPYSFFLNPLTLIVGISTLEGVFTLPPSLKKELQIRLLNPNLGGVFLYCMKGGVGAQPPLLRIEK